jgi:hypothetical protein
MTFKYTMLDDNEGLDGGPRFEIDDVHGFTVCIVDDEDTARLFCAAPDLLHDLARLVERDRAEAAECGFTDDEMTWLEDARRTIAKAKGGAA